MGETRSSETGYVRELKTRIDTGESTRRTS